MLLQFEVEPALKRWMMKRSRFREEQIIRDVEGAGGWYGDGGCLPQA
jgi:hypothetical protein